MNARYEFLTALALLNTFCSGATPTTDPTMDFILGLSHQSPATQPSTSQASTASPLQSLRVDDQSRDGDLLLSNGTTITGKISTTADKPVRIWVEQEKKYEDCSMDQIKSAQVIVIWERDEKEWNFKETGSDIKVYSGKTYPARETQYKFTLTDGTTIQGDVVLPLYISTRDGKTTTFVLYKRDKGEVGQKLTDRPYVVSVSFN